MDARERGFAWRAALKRAARPGQATAVMPLLSRLLLLRWRRSADPHGQIRGQTGRCNERRSDRTNQRCSREHDSTSSLSFKKEVAERTVSEAESFRHLGGGQCASM
jgi:hypothetical protein